MPSDDELQRLTLALEDPRPLRECLPEYGFADLLEPRRTQAEPRHLRLVQPIEEGGDA
jgi:hypothetical protein